MKTKYLMDLSLERLVSELVKKNQKQGFFFYRDPKYKAGYLISDTKLNKKQVRELCDKNYV
jgi:hypothetical protein